MSFNTENLGPNQKKWLTGKLLEEKTYPWTKGKFTIPSEKILEILSKCTETGFDTTCFREGYCRFPREAGCACKEK